MKEQIQKFIVFAFSIILLFAGSLFAQSEGWNSEFTSFVIEHIHKNGVYQGKGQTMLLLPKEGAVYAIEKEGEKVIGISTGDINFWFFVANPKNFKANLVYEFNPVRGTDEEIYFFRLSKAEKNRYIKKAEEFLSEFAQNTPDLVMPLESDPSPLTEEFLAFIQKVKKTPEEFHSKNKRISVKHNAYGSYYQLYVSYVDYRLREDYSITIDSRRPLMEATYVSWLGGDGRKTPISEEILRKVMDLKIEGASQTPDS